MATARKAGQLKAAGKVAGGVAAGLGLAAAGGAIHTSLKRRKAKKAKKESIDEERKKKKKPSLARKVARVAAFGSEHGEAPGFIGAAGHGAGLAAGALAIKAASKKKYRKAAAKHIASAGRAVAGAVKRHKAATGVGAGLAIGAGLLAARRRQMRNKAKKR